MPLPSMYSPKPSHPAQTLATLLLGSLALTGSLVATDPANADVLVTRDGRQIQTDGPWEVKGRQILFTSPGGRLSSVRLSEIDLEASELATHPPEPEETVEPEPVVEPKAPVLVLTDKDIGGFDRNTILGTMVLEVNDILRSVDDIGLVPEDHPDLQAEIDRLTLLVDELMIMIQDSCSGYATLDQPIEYVQDAAEFFPRDLESCAEELEARGKESSNTTLREGALEMAGKMNKMAKEFQADPDAFVEKYRKRAQKQESPAIGRSH